MERDFKGVWIPKSIWLDERLSALDKVILTEVDSLDQGERGCYASNKHIAEFCQCSETKVSKAIAKLIEYGYLYVQHFDGRKRELKSRLAENARQNNKKSKAGLHKVQESNTDNTTNNNTDNNIPQTENPSTDKPSTDNKNIDDEFEAIWKDYPRKLGKANALKAYKKARKNGVDYNTIRNGLMNYISYIQANKVDEKYIKHGSTWFNQNCWNDEYESNKGINGVELLPESERDHSLDHIF